MEKLHDEIGDAYDILQDEEEATRGMTEFQVDEQIEFEEQRMTEMLYWYSDRTPTSENTDRSDESYSYEEDDGAYLLPNVLWSDPWEDQVVREPRVRYYSPARYEGGTTMAAVLEAVQLDDAFFTNRLFAGLTAEAWSILMDFVYDERTEYVLREVNPYFQEGIDQYRGLQSRLVVQTSLETFFSRFLEDMSKHYAVKNIFLHRNSVELTFNALGDDITVLVRLRPTEDASYAICWTQLQLAWAYRVRRDVEDVEDILVTWCQAFDSKEHV